LSNYIPRQWECDAHGWDETKLYNNPYYPVVPREEYNDIQSMLKKTDMKTYYETVQNEEHTI
jgi:hypothetical protein